MLTEDIIKRIIYIVISDVHLGHSRNPTKLIIANLDKWFIKYHQEIISSHVLFIAGDLFDKLLDYASDDITDILLWMQRLIQFCMKHRIKLRVLEGTKSHDRYQSKHFKAMAEMNVGCDVKYINTLSIEHMSDLDIHVLYVPDEWKTEPQETLNDVYKELSKHHLSKVDIAIMHGQFAFQLPNVPNIKSHCKSSYESIVNGAINIGHIHTHTNNGKIIAQGSFDRMAHNEEEDKGGVRVTYDKDGSYEYDFLVNENAMVFKSVHMTGNARTNAMAIKKALKDAKLPCNIKLVGDKNNPHMSDLSDLKRQYPGVRFTTKILKSEGEEVVNIDLDTYDDIAITRENLPGVFKTYLLNKEMDKGEVRTAIDTLSRYL